MAESNPDLDGVKRNIEKILSGAHKGGLEKDLRAKSNGLSAPLNETSTAKVFAHELVDACNTTAADIQNAGEDIVQIASGIAAETAALAELLRRHGAEISDRIEKFAVMTTRISHVVRDVRVDLSPSKSPGPASAPGK